MIYFKSVLAGLLALIVVPLLLIGAVLVGMIIYTSIHPPQGEGAIGWDPISLWKMNPVVRFIPVFIFLAGFMWEYRRLTK